jgi:hypothetical protein
MLAWTRDLPIEGATGVLSRLNQQTVTVKGSHFLQEDALDQVGDAVARFVAKVLAGQIA